MPNCNSSNIKGFYGDGELEVQYASTRKLAKSLTARYPDLFRDFQISLDTASIEELTRIIEILFLRYLEYIDEREKILLAMGFDLQTVMDLENKKD